MHTQNRHYTDNLIQHNSTVALKLFAKFATTTFHLQLLQKTEEGREGGGKDCYREDWIHICVFPRTLEICRISEHTL